MPRLPAVAIVDDDDDADSSFCERCDEDEACPAQTLLTGCWRRLVVLFGAGLFLTDSRLVVGPWLFCESWEVAVVRLSLLLPWPLNFFACSQETPIHSTTWCCSNSFSHFHVRRGYNLKGGDGHSQFLRHTITVYNRVF